jgi:hypothetical protein
VTSFAQGDYDRSVLRKLSVRAAPVTNRAAEYAPMAPACCNVCRTCTTTNVIGLATAGIVAAAAAARRFVRL